MNNGNNDEVSQLLANKDYKRSKEEADKAYGRIFKLYEHLGRQKDFAKCIGCDEEVRRLEQTRGLLRIILQGIITFTGGSLDLINEQNNQGGI